MADNVERMSERARQLAHDLSLYSVAHVVPAVLSLGALMLFTRAFQPGMFGRYSLSLAVAGIVSTLLYGWLDYSVLRYAPQLDEQRVISNSFSIYLGISAVLTAVAVGAYLLVGDRLGPYTVFYFASLGLALARGGLQVLLAFFRSVLDSRKATLFRLVRAVVVLGLSIVLALYVLDHIVGWVWGTTLGIAVTCVLVFATSRQVRTGPVLDRDVVGRLARYGVPMVGFVVGDAFLVQADRVLLELFAGSVAVGIYSSNYMLVDRGLRLAYTPILQAMTPIIIDSWEEDNEEEIATMLTTFTRYFVLLGVPALVGIAVLSQTVSTVLVGEEFTGGYVIIPVVAVGLFLWSLANLGQVAIEIKEQTSLLSYGILVVIAVNVCLNVPLIGAFGYLGAAVATALSYALYCMFVLVFSSRHIPWGFPVVALRNALVGGAVMACPTALLYATDSYGLVTSVLAAGLGGVLYVVVLYLLDEVGRREIRKAREYAT